MCERGPSVFFVGRTPKPPPPIPCKPPSIPPALSYPPLLGRGPRPPPFLAVSSPMF